VRSKPKRRTKRTSEPRAARVAIALENGPHRGLTRADLKRRVEAMLDALQLDKAEFSLVLTDDDQIQNLNRDYRGKDKPTDVLAFAQREGEFGALAGDLLGDVIVSVPTARRQAIAEKRTLVDEVTMLVAHGLLHLLGWDHETAAKDRAMRAETARLCAAASTRRRGRASRA
jgi:probable rRNA maturation factor